MAGIRARLVAVSLLSLFTLRSAAVITLEPPTKFATESTCLNTFFDWTGVPSVDLEYSPCYCDFECARLLVPLDWNNTATSRKIPINIIRLKANMAHSNPSEPKPIHGGSILVNPGGPGTTGIGYAFEFGKTIQRHLDGHKRFEIIGFDPRGVGTNTPNLWCYFQNPAKEWLWATAKRVSGSIDSGEYAFGFHKAAEMKRSEMCASVNAIEGNNLREYVSTAIVARDMLHIIEKVEEEKKKSQKAEQVESQKVEQVESQNIEQHHLELRDLESRNQDSQTPLQQEEAKKPKLQYFGLSYGTYLGNTFASMFPDSVDKMILDSNVDAEDWSNDLKSFLVDTDRTMLYFYERCFDATERCDLWRLGDETVEDLRLRVEKFLRKLKENPLPNQLGGSLDIVTFPKIQEEIFSALYYPQSLFLGLATRLNCLMENLTLSNAACSTWAPQWNGTGESSWDARTAYMCADGPAYSITSRPGFREYMTSLTEQSTFAAIEADIKLPCWYWPFQSKWRYSGPFKSPVKMLLANNRWDPVTPLKNAKITASRHEGSRIVIHNRGGHGAFGWGSSCMWEYGRQYMNNGTLPTAEISTCERVCDPFKLTEDCTVYN